MSSEALCSPSCDTKADGESPTCPRGMLILTEGILASATTMGKIRSLGEQLNPNVCPAQAILALASQQQTVGGEI